ncbi:MAG TPA: hypothetical protein VH518_10700 [Tepidisphaeraceae bacterium]|jgi:hypothetical protein
MNTRTLAPEPTYPNPPRYRWLKRIALAWFIALVSLAGLRIWWGRDAQRRLDTVIAQIHARGQRILPAEFADPHAEDSENVAWHLNQAANAINDAAQPPSYGNTMYRDYLPMEAEWVTVARKAVEGNAKPLQLARLARACTKVDWGLEYESPVFRIMLPMLNHQRELASLLGDTAIYRHTMGDDAEALESLMDIHHAAEAVDRQPFLVSHLVSIGIDALATHRLEILGPVLRIDDEAQRRRAKALVKLLLDRSCQAAMVRSLEGERMGMVDIANVVARKGLLLRPMYQLDAIQMIRHMEPVLADAASPSYTAAMASQPPRGPWPESRLSGVISNLAVPSLNRALETDFRSRTEMTLAAVCLAVRMYRVDHGDAFPPNLAGLVPDYLPSVPIDPMSPTGSPLGYRIFNNGTRPVVYSVGSDQVDDTAKSNAAPGPLRHAGWDTSTSDQWRDLLYIPPPPPTTNAESNDFSEPQER